MKNSLLLLMASLTVLAGCADTPNSTDQAVTSGTPATMVAVTAIEYCLPRPARKSKTAQRLLAAGYTEVPVIKTAHKGHSAFQAPGELRIIVDLIENSSNGIMLRRCSVTAPGADLFETHKQLTARSGVAFDRRDLSAQTTVFDHKSKQGVEVQIGSGSDITKGKPAGQRYATLQTYVKTQWIK